MNTNRDYDAVIIGSGISGLTVGGCLAKAGLKVLILERHDTAGGMTHTFQRKGYEWAVGVHYVGEVHRPQSMLRRLFDVLSDGELQWQKVDDPYDCVILSGQSYDFPSGKEAFRTQMRGYFPGESEAIDRYLQLLDDVQQSASWFFAQKALPSSWRDILGKTKITEKFRQYAGVTTAKVMQGLSPNPLLRKVLSAQWLDYGLPPEESSFAMHALVARHYLDGASYPVGGPSALASTMKAMIEHHAGRVVTNAAVRSVLFDKKRAIGVTLARGGSLHAKTIVSAAGIHNTYRSLIPKEALLHRNLTTTLDAAMPSTAHIGLYVGLKASAQQLGLNQGNLWILRDTAAETVAWQRLEEVLGSEIPVMFVSFPSTKDPLWDVKHPGTSTIEIVIPSPWSTFSQWQSTHWQRREKAYRDIKRDIVEYLLSILGTYVSGIKDYLDHVELSTPLTTAHFCNAYQGGMYGLSHSPQRFLMPILHPDSGLEGLFLTGQDIVTCGLGGAALSGVLTALRILGSWRGRHLIRLLLGSE